MIRGKFDNLFQKSKLLKNPFKTEKENVALLRLKELKQDVSIIYKERKNIFFRRFKGHVKDFAEKNNAGRKIMF